VAREHPVLLRGGEPAEERKDLRGRQVQRGERFGGVADLALAGQEYQNVLAAAVPPRLRPQLLDRLHDSSHLVEGLLPVAVERPVAHLHGVRAPRDLEDRNRSIPRREVVGEPLRVDRRRGDDHLEVRTPREQSFQVAEEEVDVEAPLVRLVENDRVVPAQLAVPLQLREEDAVGHHLDQRVPRRVVGEPDLVADDAAQLDAELLGDPLGHGASRDPAGLGVPDGALDATAELQADLRQLGRLAGPRLAGDDDDLVVADRRRDLRPLLDDGQVLGVRDLRDERPSERGRLGHGAHDRRRKISSPLLSIRQGGRRRCGVSAPQGASHVRRRASP
jgi:hypothetical protein